MWREERIHILRSAASSINELTKIKNNVIVNFLQNSIEILRGFYLYHFSPRKTIVLITGPMRSGTTLTKALLAEAPDVSNLPEIPYREFIKLNKYLRYFHIYHLAKERIIIIKDPQYRQYEKVFFSPDFIKLKVIILKRNVTDTVRSLIEMTSLFRKHHPETWDPQRAINYWCYVYESILDDKEINNHDIVYVKYEELLKDPVKITKELFCFIGSSCNKGVDTYRKPENFEWKWGVDDGGKKIKTLRVINSTDEECDQDLLKLVKKIGRVRNLMNVLGYNL